MIKPLLLILLLTVSAQAITPCQSWVIKNWLRGDINFTTWAMVNSPTTQCEVSAAYKPTLADANELAIKWIGGELE